jgi:cellobiose epimerase
MITNEKQRVLLRFAEEELFRNILPFWRDKMVDQVNGGFFGGADFTGGPLADASKGLILNARLLWTFSSIYRLTRNAMDRRMADRAFQYLCDYFYDKEFGGYFWTVTSTGEPHETKKQIYALAFVMYGMSEYFRATENRKALDSAVELFHLIETYSFDQIHNGYFEAFERDWSEMEDIRLSDKDMNEKKTMNTHLHILEAYTNLYRVWKDETLFRKIENLVRIFLDRILSPDDRHLQLFFDEQWNLKSTAISFGHDIEAGWLIHEAALVLGNVPLTLEVEALVPGITEAALEGMSSYGGLLHEADRRKIHADEQYEWWPQAEALVGLYNAWELTGRDKYLDDALRMKEFIGSYFIDRKHGEWFFRVDSQLKSVKEYGKAGLWKCPYHNGRACLELINRINR